MFLCILRYNTTNFCVYTGFLSHTLHLDILKSEIESENEEYPYIYFSMGIDIAIPIYTREFAAPPPPPPPPQQSFMKYQCNIMGTSIYHNKSVSQSCLRSFLCNPIFPFKFFYLLVSHHFFLDLGT